MAVVYSLLNDSFSPATIEACLQHIQDALTYAGFTGLTATLSGSTDKRIDIHTGSSATDSTTILSVYSSGNDGFIMGRANSTVATTNLHWGVNIKIIATKKAVAIASSISSSPVSCVAGIISKDNKGDYVLVINSLNTGSLASPNVMPRTDEYTALLQYGATTSTAFGATALSKIPVPTYDGNARYLPSVLFAHATQYQVDGSVVLNETLKFYCIGGTLFIEDSEGNT